MYERDPQRHRRIDLALESDFNQLFMQFDVTIVPKSEAESLAALRHPRTVMTFSDSGAHVGRSTAAGVL